MKKTIAWLLVLLLCLPAMAGAEDVIKIGVFEPMTGSYAGGGEMEWEGYSLANELYPEVLGMKVELVVGDSKSDKVEASNAAASLVNSGVILRPVHVGRGRVCRGGYPRFDRHQHQPHGHPGQRLVWPHLLHRSVPGHDAGPVRGGTGLP
jgi:hypothetical protein